MLRASWRGAMPWPFAVTAPGAIEPFKAFVGISCISAVGRINIFDEAGLALDAIDDIQLWE
jgi:hypothetical protein